MTQAHGVMTLSDKVDRLNELAQELRELDNQPIGASGRSQRMLVVTGEMDRLIASLRDDAIKHALKRRVLSSREIGHLVGMSAPQVLKRGKDAGIDTSRPPVDPMRYVSA